MVVLHLSPFMHPFLSYQGGARPTRFRALDHYGSFTHSSLILHSVCVCMCAVASLSDKGCVFLCDDAQLTEQ